MRDKKMFVATMTSETKDWIALGRTRFEAEKTLLNKWNDIQKELVQEGIKEFPDIYLNFNELNDEYGVWVREISVGECLVNF